MAKISKGKMSAAERFFYDNTMIGGPGRSQAARELAAAEAYASEQGWSVDWSHDEEPYDMGNAETEHPREVLVATLRDAAGNVLASLGSIGDPTRDYARRSRLS